MTNEKQENPNKELGQAGEQTDGRVVIPEEQAPDGKDCKNPKIQNITKPSWWGANQKNIQQWLLVICTILLASYTGRLFYLTAGQTEIVIASVQSAQESAKAAQQAVKVAEKSMEVGNRAYVVVKAIDTEKGFVAGSSVAFKLTIKNVGKTPAYNISQYSRIDVLETMPQYSSKDFNVTKPVGEAILGAGMSLEIESISEFIIADRHIKGINEGKVSLFYNAIVNYSDIFKKNHVLRVGGIYSVKHKRFIGLPNCNYEE